MGLIARNPQGADILEDYHWHVSAGSQNSYCIPVKSNRFLTVRTLTHTFTLGHSHE